MKNTKVWFMFFAMLIVSALMLGACSSDKKEEGTSGGTTDGDTEVEKGEEDVAQEIRVRMNDDPDFIDPHKATATISFQMILNMFDGLFAPQTDGTLEPAIAKEYVLSDDGLTYTFTIKDDVKFHNGELVTVEDVLYTFDRLMGTTSGEPLSSIFDKVESVESPEANTVVFKLTEPNSNFLYSLTPLQSAIIPASNDSEHNNHPIGTGPFKFVSYSPSADLVMEKHTEYWKEGLPYLDKVTFVFQSDDQGALMALQGKEVDLTGIQAHRIPEVEGDFTINQQDNNSSLVILFNNQREPFNDVKVRQAINIAVNKQDIIDSVYSGYATRIGSNMSPAMGEYHKPGLENMYDRDIEKAKGLLAEAGYPDGFKTTMSVSSHNSMYADIAQVTVENLKDIGIDVEIEVIEWGIWLERIYRGRDYDMSTIDITGRPSAYEILNDYMSTNETENFHQFKNEEFDQVMTDVLLETNVDEQIKLYQRAQEILAEDSAAVYIADYQIIWALNKDLEGQKAYPFWFHDMSEVRFTK